MAELFFFNAERGYQESRMAVCGSNFPLPVHNISNKIIDKKEFRKEYTKQYMKLLSART